MGTPVKAATPFAVPKGAPLAKMPAPAPRSGLTASAPTKTVTPATTGVSQTLQATGDDAPVTVEMMPVKVDSQSAANLDKESAQDLDAPPEEIQIELITRTAPTDLKATVQQVKACMDTVEQELGVEPSEELGECKHHFGKVFMENDSSNITATTRKLTESQEAAIITAKSALIDFCLAASHRMEETMSLDDVSRMYDMESFAKRDEELVEIVRDVASNHYTQVLLAFDVRFDPGDTGIGQGYGMYRRYLFSPYSPQYNFVEVTRKEEFDRLRVSILSLYRFGFKSLAMLLLTMSGEGAIDRCLFASRSDTAIRNQQLLFMEMMALKDESNIRRLGLHPLHPIDILVKEDPAKAKSKDAPLLIPAAVLLDARGLAKETDRICDTLTADMPMYTNYLCSFRIDPVVHHGSHMAGLIPEEIAAMVVYTLGSRSHFLLARPCNQALIDTLWPRYGKWRSLLQFLTHLALCLMFSSFCSHVVDENSTTSFLGSMRVVTGLGSLILVIFELIMEIMTCYRMGLVGLEDVMGYSLDFKCKDTKVYQDAMKERAESITRARGVGKYVKQTSYNVKKSSGKVVDTVDSAAADAINKIAVASAGVMGVHNNLPILKHISNKIATLQYKRANRHIFPQYFFYADSYLALICCAIILACSPLMMTFNERGSTSVYKDNEDAYRAVMACGILSVWGRILGLLDWSSTYGLFSRIVFKMIADLVVAGAFMMLCLVTFGFSMYAYIGNTGVDGYGSVPETMMTTYRFFVMGDYDFDTYDDIGVFGYIFYILCTLLMVLLLLNLIIAIMATSYDDIMSNATTSLSMRRAELITMAMKAETISAQTRGVKAALGDDYDKVISGNAISREEQLEEADATLQEERMSRIEATLDRLSFQMNTLVDTQQPKR